MAASRTSMIRKSLIIFSGVLFTSIAIFVVSADADTPIAFGQTLSGSISTLGESDKYTFDALAGDKLYVLMSTTSKLDPYIRLYAPDGLFITLILSHHFQWWTRKGSTVPARNKIGSSSGKAPLGI
ncbi:MAG: hypothetical protein JRF56_21215 [Deltaproteobacteria bacterium]|jgi:hypothetical protein|nr:hypothetical protein [Deltaproteobacteria bacterium]